MNEFIESGENFAIQRNGADVIHDGVTIEPGRVYGRTKIFKNGNLVHNELKPAFEDGSNANVIFGGTGTTSPTGLKAYFAQSMEANIDRSLSDLFASNSDEFIGGSHPNAGKDGIIIASINDSFGNAPAGIYTMKTENISASNTYGRKWRGEFKAISAVQFAAAQIGKNLTTSGNFTIAGSTLYATQQFPTQTLAANDTLTIEWEIFIA